MIVKEKLKRSYGKLSAGSAEYYQDKFHHVMEVLK